MPGVVQYFETPCPHCLRNLRVRTAYAGQQVYCNHCNKSFVARPGVDSAPAPQDQPPSSWQEVEVVRAERDRLRGLIASLQRLLTEAQVQIPHPKSTGEGRSPDGPTRDPASDGPATTLHACGEFAIPGYRILDTLHEGPMSRVYKARQMSLDRIVAIKVLDSTRAKAPEFRMRFEREAKLASRLSHPNFIIPIDAGEVEGRLYYVMEYVEGETIEDYLASHRFFDETMAIRIVLSLAEALEYLHVRGLIHRDIKPANVILTREGGVKLADLGLARSIGDAELATAEEGKVIGTPEYISPEQICGQVDPDIRSDIYSLGATLYRMVTGRVPYDGATSQEVLRQHVDLDAVLVPPGQINPALSSGLTALTLKMLARDREERFRGPAELILGLREMLSEAVARQSPRSMVAPPTPADRST